jgi:hypothetical protein
MEHDVKAQHFSASQLGEFRAHLRAMRYLPLLVLLVTACSSSGPETSPGTLLATAKTSGGLIPCDPSKPWCGFDVKYVDAEVFAKSRTATGMVHAMLAPDTLTELDGLIAKIPLKTPDEEPTGCADSPIVTMTIDFDTDGMRTFHRGCAFDNLADLNTVVGQIHAAMIPTCTSGARITCL